MNTFPTDSATFYRLRDSRTDKCVDSPAYQQAAVVVTMAPDLLGTRTGRVLFQVAGNLLARWCRNVTIISPLRVPVVESVLAVMRDADPFGTYTAVPICPGGAAVQLHLGAGCHACAQRVVAIDAWGWLAYLGRTDGPVLHADESTVLGAIAAACLGVAQVFKIASDVPPEHWLRHGVFDLFSLSWVDSPSRAVLGVARDVGLGRLLLVGAGSVGSAVAYCLRFAGLTGDLVVVDKDLICIENFNRSPIFGRQTFGWSKVDAVELALAGTRVHCAPFPGWWEDFAAEPKRVGGAFDVWLPLANERGVRWSMQNNVPPLMIHASTGANWGVNFGRHIPGCGDCLIERFPAEPTRAGFACATGAVPTAEGGMDAALPFASLFAGLLVVADLVRLQLPGYPHTPNLAVLDFGGDFSVPLLIDRQARSGCICEQQRELTGLHPPTRYETLLRPPTGKDR
jgi:ThiF family